MQVLRMNVGSCNVIIYVLLYYLQGRSRLREIEAQLQDMARQGLIVSHDSSPDGSSDADEV